MAERDMTGREHAERGTDTTGGRSPAGEASGLAGGIGRVGAPGGLGGDLANLPPWSARAGRARPARDPAALAAWRRVAELRRRREGDAPASAVPGPASSPEADPAPAPAPEPVTDPPSILGFGAFAAGPDDDAGDPVDAEEADVEELDAEEADVEELDAEEADADPVDVHPEPRDHDRGPGEPRTGPGRPGPDRPAGPRPPEAGAAERSGRGAGEGPGGRHEVLLGLAGRLDDDALSSVRELVAVEDDAAAAELLGGALLAAGVGLTARELGVLGGWFSAARVDPELVDALPEDAEADRRGEHRFVADPPGAPAGDGPGEVIARAASRLPGVRNVRQCWRTTPAGAAPGPVPHRVLLVETHSADDCEHVAHHVAHAARDLGAVSVEVFATDADLPAYHRAAVASARPLAVPVAPPGPPPAASPAVPLSPRPAPPVPPLPARRRSVPVVPAFGTGAAADPPGPPERDDDVFRTVADAGRTVDVPEEGTGDRTVPDPPAEAGRPVAPDTVAPPAPAEDPLPDPVSTAERIAALWRRPVGEGDDGLGAGDRPTPAEAGRYRPVEPDRPDPYTEFLDSFVAPYPEVEPPWGSGTPGARDDVDPAATTGDIPVVGASRPATNGHSLAAPDRDAPASDAGDDRGRVRRARHSRGGEEESPPAPPTNGHDHGPSRRVEDAVTEPVARPAPEAGAPHPPSIDDPVDSQLSDRERELLARLHDELASRERLEAGSPDPLLGRRPPPDGPRPRPRPGAPPVNGHDLPGRTDPPPGEG